VGEHRFQKRPVERGLGAPEPLAPELRKRTVALVAEEPLVDEADETRRVAAHEEGFSVAGERPEHGKPRRSREHLRAVAHDGVDRLRSDSPEKGRVLVEELDTGMRERALGDLGEVAAPIDGNTNRWLVEVAQVRETPGVFPANAGDGARDRVRSRKAPEQQA